MSSANALMVLGGGAELSPLELEIQNEIAADNNGAFLYKPTRLKFPSGGMSAFSIDDNDVLKPPVRAIITVGQIARAFWPTNDAAGVPPLCSSADGLYGRFDPDNALVKDAQALEHKHPALAFYPEPTKMVGPWSCMGCPMAQWGSAGGERRGQACKDLRRLLLYVEGWTMPALMTLPPTSAGAFDSYSSAMQRTKGKSYFTQWTVIDLSSESSTTGIKYSVAKFSAGGPLTAEQQYAVFQLRKDYAQLVREKAVDVEDYDVSSTASKPADDDSEVDPF